MVKTSPWIARALGVAAHALFLGADADAYNYALTASAGGDGEATSDVAIGSVAATYSNPPEPSASFETYHASATDAGAITAEAYVFGVPPFAAISHSATARIEETVRLLPPPFPTGPVTVTVGLAGAAGASGAAASASAQVQLEHFSETCSASLSHTGEHGGSCPAGSVGSLTVTRTYSVLELANRGYEIDVAAQVEARLELFAAGVEKLANASGGLWVQLSGGDVADWSWAGTTTNIPTPEPSAGAIAAAALASLAALRRRRR